MLGLTTVDGSGSHISGRLSPSEMRAAQDVLSKLKHPGANPGLQFSSTIKGATVSGGLSDTLGPKSNRLIGPNTIQTHGSDTFMGGVRSAPGTVGLGVGNDTVVSGSIAKLGSTTLPDTLARGAQHLALSADTINVAGVTAASIQAEPQHGTANTHTITLSDKTTITIAGLSSHDISKLHH